LRLPGVVGHLRKLIVEPVLLCLARPTALSPQKCLRSLDAELGGRTGAELVSSRVGRCENF